MHLRTLLALLVAVAVLGLFAWWQAAREQGGAFAPDGPLLEGFDRTRVAALRVDNLERSLQLRVEAREDGSFQIVDPVVFPVEPSLLELVFDLLANQRAIPVAQSDLKKLALDPPRVVLEIEERTPGAPRTRRIEIGIVDIDQQHVFARVEGRLVRTERGLDSALERDLPDWRARRIVQMPGRAVIELRRRGRFMFPEHTTPTDLALEAVLDDAWRATAPFAAQLDRNGIGYLLASITMLQAESFIDAPGSLVHYGLDQPDVEIELVDGEGRSEVLLLEPDRESERWLAARRGSEQVYKVALEGITAIAVPGAELIERKLIDAARDEITGLELESGARRTSLVREAKRWALSVREGERVTVEREPADAAAVEELLGKLERARVSALLFERTLDSGQLTGAIRVDCSGVVQGGVIGPVERSEDGAEGVLFRRHGDALVGLIEPAVAELARIDPARLKSLELHKLPELEVARIHLAADGGAERVYQRNAKGQWSRQGNELEARDFVKLVDRLLSMRALEILQRGFDDQLASTVEARVVDTRGAEFAFTLGLFADPAGGDARVVYRTDKRLARVKPELHAELRALLSAE